MDTPKIKGSDGYRQMAVDSNLIVLKIAIDSQHLRKILDHTIHLLIIQYGINS